jgi:S-adenosylmethionine:tRNA ribosyltransferase-isomerase
LLRRGDLVVVNSTRVRSARLAAQRATGGSVELLLLDAAAARTSGPVVWEALVRPARRVRAGEVLTIAGGLTAELVSDPVEGRAEIRLASDHDDIEAAIAEHGTVPLPPYISSELRDAERYQTMFARRVGSAAAPTAGLHFTPNVVASLRAAGVTIAEVELRVGLDTFRPVTVDNIEDHQIHTEWCAVSPRSARAINEHRAAGGRVVAIGTTVARTLETFAVEAGTVGAGERATDLFITPGYRFQVVDLLMTNFHVPRSSLLMLIAAFAGDVWRSAYEAALERGYRFLSFGDAMLLESVDAAGPPTRRPSAGGAGD